MTKSTKKSGKNNPESAIANNNAETAGVTLIALEKQVGQYLSCLVDKVFDATDDFLFSNSNLSKEESAFDSARALRNQKIIFLNKFSEAVINKLREDWIESAIAHSDSESSGKLLTNSTSSSSSENNSASLFDLIENDLFNENVIRRAKDLYTPFFEGHDLSKAGFKELTEEDQCGIHQKFFCLIIDAMNEARSDLRMTQKTTLVFLKQFEQHVMLDMADFYSAASSFAKHCLLAEAEDQYQLAFVPEEPKESESNDLNSDNAEAPSYSRRLSDAVEVTIVDLCDGKGLPPYLVEMFNSQWRQVLLVIGSIRGHDSSAWNDVVKVATDLVTFATSENTATMATTELFSMVKGGLNLIQFPVHKQNELFQNLGQSADGEIEEIFEDPSDSSGQVETVLLPQTKSSDAEQNENSEMKASISEAGRKILDDDDLDDIVALLSGSPEQTKEHVQYKKNGTKSAEDSLTSFLQMVDNLKEGDEVEFVRNGDVQKCRIQTPAEKGNSFQVTNNSGEVVLARSRVGLALATKSGELRLGSLSTISRPGVSGSNTLIDANTDIEKTAAH